MTLADELFRSLNNTNPPTPRPAQLRVRPTVSPFPLFKATKPKVFVSYHHKDQTYIDAFIKSYSGAYEVFTDCSLDEAVDSTNPLYINRTIREDYITGTSVTIVVCGADTWRRKYVDWEIYSTLHKNHALLGIILPHVQPGWHNGEYGRLIPNRLYANHNSGYAHIVEYPRNAQELSQAINHAKHLSANNRHLKNNSAVKMMRNV